MSDELRDTLILSHLWMVGRLASKVRHRLYSADPDDLRSAGHMALVGAALHFRGESSFSSYAFTWIVGAMFKTFSRPTRGGKIIWCELSDLMIAEDPLPDQLALINERRRMVADAFTRLKPRHQTILWLIYIDELDKRRIARSFGWEYQRVVSLERSALNQLRLRVARPNPLIECACGCRVRFRKFEGHYRPRRFIHGHNSRLIGRMPPGTRQPRS